MSTETISRAAAIKAAGKKLPLLSAKKLAFNLDMMGADPAEAYRIGAEEAQREILSRLAEMKPAS